jgi:hypothetical protein
MQVMSAFSSSPAGWTKERQQQMDKLAEEEASRAGASVAANTTSLHAAGLGYGVNHDCHGAYLYVVSLRSRSDTDKFLKAHYRAL